MFDVTPFGSGFVAVGVDGGRGAVWTSANGRVWNRVPHDEETFATGGQNVIWASSRRP